MKIDLISTLINTMQLQIVRREHKQGYWYLQTSEAIWLYTLRSHIIIFFIDSADRYVF